MAKRVVLLDFGFLTEKHWGDFICAARLDGNQSAEMLLARLMAEYMKGFAEKLARNYKRDVWDTMLKNLDENGPAAGQFDLTEVQDYTNAKTVGGVSHDTHALPHMPQIGSGSGDGGQQKPGDNPGLPPEGTDPHATPG